MIEKRTRHASATENKKGARMSLSRPLCASRIDLEGTEMKVIAGYKVAFLLLALIPLVFWIVVSCSSTPGKVELTTETVAQWNAAVEKTIKEPQRATKLKDLGQQLIDISKSIQQDINTFNQKATLLNENYDTTHEEFQQAVEKFTEQRNPQFAKYRDTIFAMRNEVSAEEWKALMK